MYHPAAILTLYRYESDLREREARRQHEALLTHGRVHPERVSSVRVESGAARS